MWDNKQAVKVAEVCLVKCGLVRNLQHILEAIEEKIFGEIGPLNADAFFVSDDYRNMKYNGSLHTSFDVLKHDVLNSCIDCEFTDREFEWLKVIALNGSFTINTRRSDGAIHDFRLAIDAPLSPTNSATDKVRLLVHLEGVQWKSTEFSLGADVEDTDLEKLSKAHTLYSMV